MNNDFEYKFIKPDKSLDDFVEGFWMLKNHSETSKDIVILPDGRIDLFFSQSATEPFHITLSGLETHADKAPMAAKTTMFAISFKLLATEFLFQNTVSDLLDNVTYFARRFLGLSCRRLKRF